MATLRIAVVTALACGMLASASVPMTRAGETSEVTFGSQAWSQSKNDAKYQEFREVPRGGYLESFVLRQWSGRNMISVQGVNSLNRDQNTKLTVSNGVRYRLDLGYQEIPHLFSQTARWGWLQSSPGVFTLPDSLQARNQLLSGASYTARMLDYLKGAPAIDLGFATEVKNARLRYRPVKGWQLEARGSMRTRDGLKPYAMSFGFSTALENPEPIDQTMTDVDLIADYRRAAFTLQAIGGVSTFRNDISTLYVDNPKRITSVDGGDGTARGAMDLYPNNKVLRGTLAMAYELPRQSSFTATLGLASGKQDDPFLPFTTNSALPQSNPDSLPGRNLDGKTTQITGDLRLRTRPMDKLDGTLRFHYSDYKNDSKVFNFIGQAPYEATWQRFIEHENDRFDATAWQAGIDADYEISSSATIGGLAEYRLRERSPREVEKDGETVFGGRLRVSVPSGVTLNGNVTHGNRKMDRFLLEDYDGLKANGTTGVYDTPGALEQPGLRRFDVADRAQDLANVALMMPLGDRIDLDASYGFTHNNYKSETKADTMLGLNEEKVHSVSAGATFHVSESLDLTGSYGFGLTSSDQRSRASAATMNFLPDSSWSALLKDKESYVNVGFVYAPAKRKLSWSGDYEISRTMTTYDLDNGLHNAADMDNVFYRRQDANLEASWHWLTRTSIVARYNWEQFDMIDWAANNVPVLFPVVGNSSAIFLGDSSRSYTANRVSLVMRHRF